MRTITIAFLVALSGCITPVDSGLEVDSGIEHINIDAGVDVCLDPSLVYPTCAGCHDEAATPAGWYAANNPCLSGDSWGRWAFFVLFTQANSVDIPEHAAPYDVAEDCFCIVEPARPYECRTLTGDFEPAEDCIGM